MPLTKPCGAYKAEFCLEIRPFGNVCPHDCDFCYQIRKEHRTSPLQPDVVLPVVASCVKYAIHFGIKNMKLVFHGGEPAQDGGATIFSIVDAVNNEFPFNSIALKYTCHTSGYSKLDVNGFAERGIRVCLNRKLQDNSPSTKVRIHCENSNSLFEKRMLNGQIVVLTKESLSEVSKCLEIIEEFRLPTKLQPQFPDPLRKNNELDLPKNTEILSFLEKLVMAARIRSVPLDRVEIANQMLFSASQKSLVGCRFTDECPFTSGPIKSLVLDNDGMLYPCNRFAGIRAFSFGHYANLSLELLPHEVEKIFLINNWRHNYKEKVITAQCKKCILYHDGVCTGTGGCPFFMHIWGSEYSDPYCDLNVLVYKSMY